jgi:hypothetical protein
MRLALKETQLGLRNSTTRIPFRYGTACLTRCPQATLRVVIESGGRRQEGFSGDCLPPSWFDKSPTKDFAAQIADMLRVIAHGEKLFRQWMKNEKRFFDAWISAQVQMQKQCREWELPPLLASFGCSMVERAILDAICRLNEVSFAQAIRGNLFQLQEAGLFYPDLKGLLPKDWLPAQPRTSVYVRQTVGLGDPLTTADIPAGEKLNDGWPQAIEEYVVRRGIRYFKVKVSNRLEHDLDRLQRLARLLEGHLGENYWLTLDGNEQYKQVEEFDHLIQEIRGSSELATLWKNVLAIEQPLDRHIALDREKTKGLRKLSQAKPIIIDESEGTLLDYSQAIALGYRGVSSKNCKSAIKSVLNAGLTWIHNARGQLQDYLMTGEDLCSVGIIPTQSDLCLAATLGLEHVERNGHHYHPGLTYLPADQRQAALAQHGDFYTDEHGIIGPNIVDGKLQIGSLQCVGFGFAVEPDMSSMESPDTWRFDSLGI